MKVDFKKADLNSYILRQHGIYFHTETESQKLPDHVETVREALFNFDNSVRVCSHLRADFSADLHQFLEQQPKANGRYLGAPGNEQVWKLCPPISLYHENEQPRRRNTVTTSTLVSARKVSAKFTHLRLREHNEQDWQHFLRVELFKMSIERVDSVHGAKPDEWILSAGLLWTEAEERKEHRTVQLRRSKPMPDITYGFAVFDRSVRQRLPLLFDCPDSNKLFSRDFLSRIRSERGVKIKSTPQKFPTSDLKALRNDNRMCFPWAVLEIKKNETKSSEKCHSQAANAAAAALEFRKGLFHRAYPPGDQRDLIPPVVAFTSVGAWLRVWLAYLNPADQSVRMVCVWATNLELPWGVLATQTVIKNMHDWAAWQLKFKLTAALHRVAEKLAITQDTVPQVPTAQPSGNDSDSCLWESTEASDIDDSEAGQSCQSMEENLRTSGKRILRLNKDRDQACESQDERVPRTSSSWKFTRDSSESNSENEPAVRALKRSCAVPRPCSPHHQNPTATQRSYVASSTGLDNLASNLAAMQLQNEDMPSRGSLCLTESAEDEEQCLSLDSDSFKSYSATDAGPEHIPSDNEAQSPGAHFDVREWSDVNWSSCLSASTEKPAADPGSASRDREQMPFPRDFSFADTESVLEFRGTAFAPPATASNTGPKLAPSFPMRPPFDVFDFTGSPDADVRSRWLKVGEACFQRFLRPEDKWKRQGEGYDRVFRYPAVASATSKPYTQQGRGFPTSSLRASFSVFGKFPLARSDAAATHNPSRMKAPRRQVKFVCNQQHTRRPQSSSHRATRDNPSNDTPCGSTNITLSTADTVEKSHSIVSENSPTTTNPPSSRRISPNPSSNSSDEAYPPRAPSIESTQSTTLHTSDSSARLATGTNELNHSTTARDTATSTPQSIRRATEDEGYFGDSESVSSFLASAQRGRARTVSPERSASESGDSIDLVIRIAELLDVEM